MSVILVHESSINLMDFKNFTQFQLDDALGVIMDSRYSPKNQDMLAFRYDADLARGMMNFVDQLKNHGNHSDASSYF